MGSFVKRVGVSRSISQIIRSFSFHQSQYYSCCLAKFQPTTVFHLGVTGNFLSENRRNIHGTGAAPGFFGTPQDEPLFKRIARKLGWSETSKSYLMACGYLMYIKVADEVNYRQFFKECQLEDTFVSWFIVVELHLWLLAARLMQEGDEGRVVRNSLFKALWEDCEAKTKKLEGALASARKRQVIELGDQFQATIVSYDEGLLGNDAVLAGALWRRFIGNDKMVDRKYGSEEMKRDAIILEMLVSYVRSQYYKLNELHKHHILKRKFDWSAFDASLIGIAQSELKIKKLII